MTLPMQKGYYNARATSTPIVFGKSSNGNIQIAIEFAIEDEAFVGEVQTWVGHFTDKTTERTIESLCHAGWSGDDVYALRGVPGSEALPEMVQLVIEPEEYEGEWTLKVQWVNKPGAGRFKFKEEATEGDLRALGARLRATVKSVRAQGGAPRKPAQPRTPTAPSGGGSYGGHPNAPGNGRDDIPFASASMADEPMLALRSSWV